MNPHTGRIYEGEAEIAAARERGEELVPLADGIAESLKWAERQHSEALARQQQARERAAERERNRQFVQRSLGARR